MWDDAKVVSSESSAMDKDRDLLPWILGALSIASVALAVAVAAANRVPPSIASAPIPPASLASPVVALPAPAAPAVPAESSPVPVAAQSPATTTPAAMQPTGQIWACTLNGQKTFSNNPCGEKSALLDLGPINTMDRAPVYRAVPSYPPGPGYAPAYDEPDPQESADNGYPAMVAIPVFARRNPPRTHRPFNHGHSPPARKF